MLMSLLFQSHPVLKAKTLSLIHQPFLKPTYAVFIDIQCFLIWDLFFSKNIIYAHWRAPLPLKCSTQVYTDNSEKQVRSYFWFWD